MIITAGATNKNVYFYIVGDASHASPGDPITGLLFSDIETGGSASYARQGAARVDLTLITLASASAAHADGGFILVDDTNMPGVYRCDYPDAAFAAGVDQVICDLIVAPANNAVAAPILVDITDFDLRTASPVVASVTGAVGSVAGNVTGSVGSNLELGPAEVNSECDTAISDAALATAANLATVIAAVITNAAGADVAADIIAVKAVADSTLADTASMGIVKNATFSNFEFPMVLTSDHYTAATLKTVTGEMSIDGAAFVATNGTIAEVSDGIYQIDLTAADTNGDFITYKFSATDCDDTVVSVTTRA